MFFTDCSIEIGESDAEPMVGLQQLLLGAAQMTLKKFHLAIDAYYRCIKKRAHITNQDMHISAFAHYELATLLLHCNGNVTNIIPNYF